MKVFLVILLSLSIPCLSAIDTDTIKLTKKELKIFIRSEACRTMCIKDDYDGGIYEYKTCSCLCIKKRNYEEYYRRTVNIGTSSRYMNTDSDLVSPSVSTGYIEF